MRTVPLVYSQADVERFWTHVPERPDNGCWLWTGDRNRRGYGRLHVGGVAGTKYLAHRLAVAIVGREVPVGMAVCHTCDTPACVNPAHLFVAPQAENVRDMVDKGRGPSGDKNGSHTRPDRRPRGERHGLAKATVEIVQIIRAEYVPRKNGKALAARFNLSTTAIRDIYRGRRWGHVPSARAAGPAAG